ncbi:hypothetical protein P4S64_18085 [Vibrio sp. M60_M31a]
MRCQSKKSRLTTQPIISLATCADARGYGPLIEAANSIAACHIDDPLSVHEATVKTLDGLSCRHK